MDTRILSFFVVLTAGCEGFLFGHTPDWDNLKVTWGVSIFNTFVSQPSTIEGAKSKGYTTTDGDSCKSDGYYRGVRYLKDGDTAIMLLFDKNGFIAGIQTGFPKDASLKFPTPQLKYRKVFNEESDKYTQTFYFTHPDKICSEGRTQAEYNQDGTGKTLYLQIGPNPTSDLMQIPYKESDMPKTRWTKGQCFVSMGMHYWYNITADMNCDNFLPAFVLYNNGRLNGFGFALNARLTSSRYEHPPPSVFANFLKPVPQCLYQRHKNGFSTMHVFLDSWPRLNSC